MWRFGHGRSSASAVGSLPVHRRRSERGGTLKGNKAHGWIGCAALETAAVHYGLVSGVKPCSRAASSRASLLRHLATGGAGARGQRLIPGVCCLQHATLPGSAMQLPGLGCRHSLRRGRSGSSVSRSLLRKVGSGASLEHPGPAGSASAGATGQGLDAGFLAESAVSAAVSYQAFRLRQPEYSLRWVTRVLYQNGWLRPLGTVETDRLSSQSGPHRRVSLTSSSFAGFGQRKDAW
jgi:hypothetical protein